MKRTYPFGRFLYLAYVPAHVVLGVVLLSSAALAQHSPPPPFTSVPLIEDQELYYQFFQYHLGGSD
jgi:hypothetical protein